MTTCRDCSKPATNGVLCKEHRDKYNKVSKHIREDRKQRGVCARCGNDLDPNSIYYCTVHMLEAKKKNKRHDIKLSGGIRHLLEKERLDKRELLEARKKLAGAIQNSSFLINLDSREKDVLNLRILSGAMSLRKVGKRLGLTYEFIRQIENSIAKKLKIYLERQKIAILEKKS